MKTILILAGGFGTRLKTVVPDVPKPLAPVLGRPFLRYLVENCVSQGANDLIFLLHHKAGMIEKALKEMSKSEKFKGVKIQTLREDYPLGTGGSIKNAVVKFKLQQSFLVMNADTWLGAGLESMEKFHCCALAAVKVENCQRYGALVIQNKIVKKFQEKSILPKSGWVNAGLYHLSPEYFIEYSNLNSFSLEQVVLRDLVLKRKLLALKIDTQFIDIGVPEDYAKFCDMIELGVSYKT
jgi:D-glycero-alpha-D-manno-heptose 1-phosphate guanylyltransferase